ncbi:Hypothetical protein EHI5A_136200 [Entamoeba histolytica KU27]|uniref:Uncharacterized protein n=1 Tax=Entamoeba histolytica KU27 TaxID=885311 RepID=M2QB27_ENTHI|nr:Hypothetical protein EHI5A_136200 [Entamoeba histolytica KU27]
MVSAVAEHSTINEMTTQLVFSDMACDSLCDRFKLLFEILTPEQNEVMTNDMYVLANEYSFNLLFFNYEIFRYGYCNGYSVFERLRHEYTYIMAIIYKVRITGIQYLSQPVIDWLLLYIDDWCLRDGISVAWDVAEELYEMALNRERLEEENEEYVFHWECEDSSLTELDLNKP